MFVGQRKKRERSRARVALLAGGVVAALGFGALNAGAAAAAPACTGNSITGQGASLQKIAQQNVWGPNFGNNICNKGSLPKIAYNSTGSGAGLKEWNYDGTKGSINTGLAWISTDDAPTAAQIANIKSTGGGAQLAVIPITQTAIAIVANPPAGCTVEEITNTDLTAVFEGRFLTWNQLDTAEGTCTSPITRVVRKDGSGTTFQYKNYLFQTNKKALACTGAEKQTWQQLEPITNSVTGAPNTTWPETCAEKTLSAVVRPAGTGGGEVVKTVNTTAGSIGYAALPDAMANKTTAVVLQLQNNGLGSAAEASFASPASGSTANCGTMTYKTPANVNTGLDIDWSAVFGAKPAIGEGGYPLCTLTYALAFHGYGLAGFAQKDEITVRDYLTEYVTQAAGQSDINSNFYSALPSTPDVRTNILGAAQKAAVRISF
ncbi:MAG: PstS family phosphate ABC transporter substrate-binding protein [Solirubrobacterales bacterium]